MQTNLIPKQLLGPRPKLTMKRSSGIPSFVFGSSSQRSGMYVRDSGKMSVSWDISDTVIATIVFAGIIHSLYRSGLSWVLGFRALNP